MKQTILIIELLSYCYEKVASSPNRDTPINSNDIVITSKTMGKYSKTVDDWQYRVDLFFLPACTALYCKSSTVLLYFPIVLLVITISLLFSGVSLM